MSCRNLLKTVVLPVLLIISQFTYAQERTITGKVTDSKDGTPIARASVVAKGSNKGTTTAEDGTFKLNVGQNVTTLVITSVGYGRMEVNVAGQTSVSAALNAANSNLNEVVVVGYGTRKVKDLTGSIATVSAKDFNKGVIASPQELFQGRTPGVNVIPSSGEPGAGVTVNIRGTTSTRGSDPLYIVDGIPLYGGGSTGTASGVEGSSTPKNPLIFLNPSDIESVTILKDAASTAIYGAAGANGVILITTKNGKGGKGSFQFGASTSVSTTAKRYDLLNASDFLLAVKKANIDAGTSPADAAVAVQNVDKGYNTNWQDQIFQTGISQNYNLGWGFARKATTLRLSGAYDDQTGIVKNSSMKRLTGRVNFTQKFLQDKLKLEANVAYSNIKNEYPPNTNNAGYQGSLIGAAITFNPTYPVHNPDGTFFDPLDGNRNPAEMLAYFTDKDNINRVLSGISLSYKIIDGLVYKITFGEDYSKGLRKSFADPRLSPNAFGGTNSIGTMDLKNPINGNGRGIYQNYKYNSTLLEHLLTYDKTFKNGDELNAIAGYHYQDANNYYWNDLRWGLATPVVKATDVFVKDINNFTTKAPIIYGDTSKGSEQSYFARANYTIQDKYYFSGTVRVDGDSRFGSGHKYGTFPAGAFKWRISNENFAKNSIDKIFNDLAIRVNYGLTGSKIGLPYYASQGIKQTYFGTPVYLTNANPNLKWESTLSYGSGIDFTILNGRVRGTVDYFHKETSNQIFYAYWQPRANTPWQWQNIGGKVVNKGVEVSLDVQALKNKSKNGLNWDISYNMTFLKNSVKDLPSPINTGAVNGQGLSGAYAQIVANGYPIFSWIMPVFLGFDGNGNARYANGSANKILGSAIPKFTAGLTNNFSLGRWTASIFMNTATGFYIYNNTANALFLKGSIKTAHNVTYAVANSPEDPINPGSVSSRFLEKGNFIRMSNASLGYTFMIKNSYIKTINALVSGQNLFLITKYTGLDPEVNVDHSINNVPSRGFDYAAYPKARTVTLGVNIGF